MEKQEIQDNNQFRFHHKENIQKPFSNPLSRQSKMNKFIYNRQRKYLYRYQGQISQHARSIIQKKKKQRKFNNNLRTLTQSSKQRKYKIQNQNPRRTYYLRSVPLNMLIKEDKMICREYQPGSIYEWNFDYLTEHQIFNAIQQMIIAVLTSMTKNKSK